LSRRCCSRFPDADTVVIDATPHGDIGYKRHVISVPSLSPAIADR
jgi:hypothetical protein